MSNFRKLFSSETITGRANVAKATYASFAVLYIMHRLRKRSKAAAKCPDCGCQNCASHSDSPEAAAGKSLTEGTCDPEIWKRSLISEKSPAPTRDDGDTNESTISAGEVSESRSDVIGGGEGVEGRAEGTDKKENVKVHSREHEHSVVNAVWGCDI